MNQKSQSKQQTLNPNLIDLHFFEMVQKTARFFLFTFLTCSEIQFGSTLNSLLWHFSFLDVCQIHSILHFLFQVLFSFLQLSNLLSCEDRTNCGVKFDFFSMHWAISLFSLFYLSLHHTSTFNFVERFSLISFTANI